MNGQNLEKVLCVFMVKMAKPIRVRTHHRMHTHLKEQCHSFFLWQLNCLHNAFLRAASVFFLHHVTKGVIKKLDCQLENLPFF